MKDFEGKIQDGGERISYGSGKAIREPATGKGRYDLISPYATRRLAKWYELGSRKYADRNWENGIPYSRYIDSTKRHIDKFIMGMEDEDHLAAAAWNIFAIMHHQELGQDELDDMPHYESALRKEVSRNSDSFKITDVSEDYSEESICKKVSFSYEGVES